MVSSGPHPSSSTSRSPTPPAVPGPQERLVRTGQAPTHSHPLCVAVNDVLRCPRNGRSPLTCGDRECLLVSDPDGPGSRSACGNRVVADTSSLGRRRAGARNRMHSDGRCSHQPAGAGCAPSPSGCCTVEREQSEAPSLAHAGQDAPPPPPGYGRLDCGPGLRPSQSGE